jgi:flagellar basal-body rod protein FlgB
MPSPIFGVLNHRMDYLIARQGVVASNIANADTPQYLAKDITFKPKTEGHFAMLVTNARHITPAGGSTMAIACAKISRRLSRTKLL